MAFGPSPFAGIVITAEGNSPNVALLEIVLRRGGDDARGVLNALASVPSPEPLMLVDWNWATAVRLDRPQEEFESGSARHARVGRC